MTTYFVNIREIPLLLIKNGEKTIELRVNKGIFRAVKVGDKLWFSHHTDLLNNIEKNVIRVEKYKSFRECLETNVEILHTVNPLSNSIEESLDIYLKPNGIYTKEKESKFGVVALFIN
jgi:ASC-1-like (ASCH) protein